MLSNIYCTFSITVKKASIKAIQVMSMSQVESIYSIFSSQLKGVIFYKAEQQLKIFILLLTINQSYNPLILHVIVWHRVTTIITQDSTKAYFKK